MSYFLVINYCWSQEINVDEVSHKVVVIVRPKYRQNYCLFKNEDFLNNNDTTWYLLNPNSTTTKNFGGYFNPSKIIYYLKTLFKGTNRTKRLFKLKF